MSANHACASARIAWSLTNSDATTTPLAACGCVTAPRLVALRRAAIALHHPFALLLVSRQSICSVVQGSVFRFELGEALLKEVCVAFLLSKHLFQFGKRRPQLNDAATTEARRADLLPTGQCRDAVG